MIVIILSIAIITLGLVMLRSSSLCFDIENAENDMLKDEVAELNKVIARKSKTIESVEYDNFLLKRLKKLALYVGFCPECCSELHDFTSAMPAEGRIEEVSTIIKYCTNCGFNSKLIENVPL